MADGLRGLVEFGSRMLLGIDAMDETHREFVALCVEASEADNARFAVLLRQLFEHTEAHFQREETLMRESGFPALTEHVGEHQRVLGELNRFLARAQAGNTALARAWLQDAVPEWFRSHLLCMDSALAAHLKVTDGGRDVRLRL